MLTKHRVLEFPTTTMLSKLLIKIINLAQSFFGARASALRRGKGEGLKEGEKTKALETAKKMLANNLDPKLIASCTGLILEEIIKLKN